MEVESINPIFSLRSFAGSPAAHYTAIRAVNATMMLFIYVKLRRELESLSQLQRSHKLWLWVKRVICNVRD
jgi:hypothetical protein